MRISDWSSDVCSSDLAPLIKPGFRTRDLFRGRHPEQGQIIEAFEMRAFLAELLAALDIDQRRDGVGEIRDRIGYRGNRSEEHTSELQSLMRISYAVFCLKKTRDQ